MFAIAIEVCAVMLFNFRVERRAALSRVWIERVVRHVHQL